MKLIKTVQTLINLPSIEIKMNRSTTEIRASDNQFKFINDRISVVEKFFAELCSQFASLARRTAKMRDGGDDLAKTILSYAEQENLNRTLRVGLTKFSECLSSVQDYRQAQIHRLEAKVIRELSYYGVNCKKAKDDMKTNFVARAKEQSRKQQLQKLRERNPTNVHQISQAEIALQRATVEAAQTSKILEDQMDQFERKKLSDLKKILSDFVNIELLFHAKALEMYTTAYKSILLIDEQEDLEDFRNTLHLPTQAARLDLVRASSRVTLSNTHSSINSLPQHVSPSSRTTPEPAPRFKITKPSNMQVQNLENESDGSEDDEDDVEMMQNQRIH